MLLSLVSFSLFDLLGNYVCRLVVSLALFSLVVHLLVIHSSVYSPILTYDTSFIHDCMFDLVGILSCSGFQLICGTLLLVVLYVTLQYTSLYNRLALINFISHSAN